VRGKNPTRRRGKGERRVAYKVGAKDLFDGPQVRVERNKTCEGRLGAVKRSGCEEEGLRGILQNSIRIQ